MSKEIITIKSIYEFSAGIVAKQWSGITEDGRTVFIRAKDGEICMGIGQGWRAAVLSLRHICNCNADHQKITESKLRDALGHVVVLPKRNRSAACEDGLNESECDGC